MSKDIYKKVLNTMKNAGKPLKTAEIIELSGVSKNDVSKALKVLKTDGKITSPKRCFYSPVN